MPTPKQTQWSNQYMPKIGRRIIILISYVLSLSYMPHIISKGYADKCSHPLFKKKQTRHKNNEIHEKDEK